MWLYELTFFFNFLLPFPELGALRPSARVWEVWPPCWRVAAAPGSARLYPEADATGPAATTPPHWPRLPPESRWPARTEGALWLRPWHCRAPPGSAWACAATKPGQVWGGRPGMCCVCPRRMLTSPAVPGSPLLPLRVELLWDPPALRRGAPEGRERRVTSLAV